jgi:hypothetical protein
MLTDFCDNINE